MKIPNYNNMNIFLVLSVCAFLIEQLNCIQTLYKFDPEHCEVTNINESLVEVKEKKCFKLSRTELYLNLSIRFRYDIVNDKDAQVQITGYQLRSNEYRKGPIEFMLGMCSSFTSKLYDIPHMFANSNFRCPLFKSHLYYAYNLSPNATNMPHFIPEGRWLLQLDYMYLNRYQMFSVKWFSGVEYLRDWNIKNRTILG